MDLKASCGDCDFFVEMVQQHLGALLTKHEFRSVQCEADRGGRECTWMLESDRCRLLFTLSDGQEDCSMGKLDTPFPEKVSFYLNGELGWYNSLWLMELRSGKQLLTRKLTKRMLEGDLEYFAWLAPLLEEWMPELMGMFGRKAELTWHNDLITMLEARRP